ncbi:MAG: non-ribosomal peptide synthetase, partial [Xanthobacteraceae bacterium]
MSEVLDDERRMPAGASGRPRRRQSGITADPDSRFEPFPLTEVQRAYWLGRSEYFELGNVGCHIYLEFVHPLIAPGRLQEAWHKLIIRHDMLRAVIRENGLQQVLVETPEYDIRHYELAAMQELQDIRDRLSHQVFSPDQWPMFELCTSEFDSRTVLHFSMDLMFVDVWSVQLILDELLQLVADPSAALPEFEITFRDFMISTVQADHSVPAGRAEAYWQRRLSSLPPSPKLPLRKSHLAVASPKFVRRAATLEPEVWDSLRMQSAKANITGSGALLAAYVRVLATWSQNSHFTLNTTLLLRDGWHPDVPRLAGEFTGTLLLEVQEDVNDSFPALARRVATQFRSDLKHRRYSGLRVLQDLAKQGDPTRPPLMPVVFTSAVADKMTGWPLADQLDITYGVSQTPQVYLDCQILQRGGRIEITWDAVEELFPAGLLDDMFAAYCDYLRRLAQDARAWSETGTVLLPGAQLELRAAVNDTAAPLAVGLLHEPFLEQARLHPDALAVASATRRLSYGDLARQTRGLARQLRAMGAGPNRLVAVVMEKGWEQVVAAIAILEAGAAYLPVDPELPQQRRWLLLERGAAEIVLTQPCFVRDLAWPTDVLCLAVEWQEAPVGEDAAPSEAAARAEDLAYVIFTSGSTGEPKGVMIEHRSALNTILDINERFGIGAGDRVLALSALSFDLSVYDMFGALAAGATIVLPHPTSSHQPEDWAQLVLEEKVTLWNSVPALLELLLDHVGGRRELLGNSLRLALLSGDWIALPLADRARALLPGLKVVSLGGATEASIWSIVYPIGSVPVDWRSIPYGRALRNQQMHVLNEAMQPCPTWVAGQIYIGGAGLARGYWGDETKTQAQFVRHPRTGERLYRTGDLGRYLPDGNIEFLGREDEQVKVQGYRIELGEIEAALERHGKVKSAVVTAVGERSGPKRLVAYVVGASASEEELVEHLQRMLPPYMVPTVWQKLETLPLTMNGKVDRRALPEPVLQRAAQAPATAPPLDVLQRMSVLIAQELKLASVDAQHNLLALGATSMDLVRIVTRLQKELDFRPSFQQFLRNPSVAA